MKKSVPISEKQWMNEIAAAYLDTKEVVAISGIIGAEISESDMFQIAPVVCLKNRQIKATEKNQKRATDAALSSYVANEDINGGMLKRPVFAFAFCYILAHYGLDLIDEEECEKTVIFIESNISELEKIVKG